MTKGKAGNSKFLKDYNETGILNLIRTHGRISRSELSRLTSLSPTATGAIVSKLIDKGYIHETGTGRSNGGRKPVLVELKPNSFFSVGVDLDTDRIDVVLIDVRGTVVLEKSVAVSGQMSLEYFILEMENTILNILSRYLADPGKLLGIGISVAGMVDSANQEVVFAPNLGWKNVNIKPMLKRLPEVPIHVENEAMASAICENWLGACRGVDNFICINIGSGIGAGIFTDGKLYKGIGGNAGEVGHIVVDEDGPLCGCGNYGCLETLASTSRIVEKAKKLARQGVELGLDLHGDNGEITIDSIIEAARAGNEAARNILMESAKYLGIAISYLANILNPSKIVIGKEFVRYADLVMDHVKEIASRKALKTHAAKMEISTSEIGEKSSALGAAVIPLKAVFGK